MSTLAILELNSVSLKEAVGMGHSADPGKPAPELSVWCGSALFAQTYLSQLSDFLQ